MTGLRTPVGTPNGSPNETPGGTRPFDDVSRLSFNQITADGSSLREVVEGCARHGIPYVSVWRHKLAEIGVDAAAKLLRDTGVRVSSVCRGGMFPASTSTEREARIDDNLRAIDEAAALGAEVLVLVCGAAPDRDIGAARAMVAEGVSRLVPYARQCGVQLGIEPLHPAFAAERSCINTLRQATQLAAALDPDVVGVVADVYHVWWDPELYDEIARAGSRIIGFHVSDWLVPATNVLMSRGMMGDGVIELRRIRAAVDRIGYAGPIEVEIFNSQFWPMPVDELLPLTKQRYLAHV